LKVCRHRKPTIESLGLLVNDLRPIDEPTKTWARWYGSELGFAPAVIEQAISSFKHRTYTADERAKILGVPYAKRQLLRLRRTGSIDVDKAGRERARRDRGNAARREKTAAERVVRANERDELTREIAQLTSIERVYHSNAVNRCNPSLEAQCSNRIDSDSQENHWIKPKTIGINTGRSISTPILACEMGATKAVRSDSEHLHSLRCASSQIVGLKHVINRIEPQKIDRPPSKPSDEHIPFHERVELMQRHCGLSRAEAEAEALKWEGS